MKKFFVFILIVTVLFVGCGGSSVGGGATTSGGSSSPTTIFQDSGDADKITSNFTVSGGCSSGKLEYSGTQIKPTVDSAWVNFRIYDTSISDYSIESSGPHDLIPTGNGSSRVSLDPGTYYVEVENWNSEWEFSIICQ